MRDSRRAFILPFYVEHLDLRRTFDSAVAGSAITIRAGASLFAVAAIAFLLGSGSARAAGASDCAKLTTLAVERTTITSAALVAPIGVFPESCRVVGYVETEINFELRLPSSCVAVENEEGDLP
jgi:hypothetical protein